MKSFLPFKIPSHLPALAVLLISIAIISSLSIEIVRLNTKIKQFQNEIVESNSKLTAFHQTNLEFLNIASLSAQRKSEGLDIATVEAALVGTKQEILNGNFSQAATTLMELENALDSLFRQKQESDKLASEAAKKMADADRRRAEEAARKSAIPTSSPTNNTDPNSIGNGYSRSTISTKNGSFTISVVKVNLATSRVIMDSANDNDCADSCPTMSLADYVARNGATYGINGTYFCPPDYANCAGKVSSYDFPIFNTRLGRWLNQGNLYWTNRAMMTFPSGGAAFYPNSNAAPTGGFNAAIVSSPGLVYNGVDIVGQYQLTSAQSTKGARGGLGVKGSTLFMVIASGASVPDLAAIFRALGVDHALNIDGGGSSALWAGGYRVGPGRSLPNALMIAQ